jgi:uncharacterized membrane protein SpoIIM required for sporulation
VIIDVPRFVAAERSSWSELDRILTRLETEPRFSMTLEETRRFFFLYQKTSADLAKFSTFAAEPQIRAYLESLVARAYGEIHESRERGERFSPRRWFFHQFPRAFRRHIRAFWTAVAVMLAGVAFGAGALRYDHDAKAALMPFDALQEAPGERVAREERAKTDRLAAEHSSFSAYLMTHNIRVSLLTLGMGVTAGAGTIVLLFYNGVIIGAVAADYVMAGQTQFLLGWLLPHGVIEIPAVLVAGQAGLLLGYTMIGRSSRRTLRERLRAVSPDLLNLVFGLAVLLIWAGLVEAFLSQLHRPVIPYELKIGFGLLELLLLITFLATSGRDRT